MDTLMQMSRGLDLSQLLLVHTGIALVSGVGTAPSYNLPVYLFALSTVHSKFDQVQMKRATIILAGTVFLDVLWVLAKGTLSLTLLFILGNLLLKPITVACAVQLLQSNGATFPGLSFRGDAYEPMGGDEDDMGHADAAVISMPGALSSS
ncbi:hypothetical protein GQ54DRAFT_57833 [Martensiomyces pterosporus]|nr:hypothetical protein GQ54DRAFT_57833 [Martensiomyces pterosporus]